MKTTGTYAPWIHNVAAKWDTTPSVVLSVWASGAGSGHRSENLAARRFFSQSGLTAAGTTLYTEADAARAAYLAANKPTRR